MTLHSNMVLLEHVASGDPAQACALKVQQLPLDQQYSVHSTCSMLSAPSASSTYADPQDGAGAAALLVLGALLISMVIYALKERATCA